MYLIYLKLIPMVFYALNCKYFDNKIIIEQNNFASLNMNVLHFCNQ